MKYKAPVDIDTAIRIYYQYPEINNKQMRELFGSISSTTEAKYKKAVMAVQMERGVKTMQLHTVNTKVAYEVWGIDVEDLVKRRNILKELGFIE